MTRRRHRLKAKAGHIVAGLAFAALLLLLISLGQLLNQGSP
ncbi:hypothetical protein [Streptomyces mirabilis]|nr:hypothetical protein [Streptomyces mirabilis]MCX4609462.1 hypothetical protein [Streptomyces mirabilis]